MEKFENPQPTEGQPFSWKEIKKVNPETGEMLIEESSGEKWVSKPEVPPRIKELEEKEKKEKGVVNLIELIPKKVRETLREIAREQTLVELEKDQSLMADKKKFAEEFEKLYKIKELELAQKWLERRGKIS